VLGALDVLVALALLAAVWLALPARVWVVDLAGSLAAGAFLVGGVGLLAGATWAHRVALAAGGLVLSIGIALVTTLAWTASHLVGLYGPVGGGGALILVVVAALLLPYLVFLPAAQVWQLLPGSRGPSGPP